MSQNLRLRQKKLRRRVLRSSSLSSSKISENTPSQLLIIKLLILNQLVRSVFIVAESCVLQGNSIFLDIKTDIQNSWKIIVNQNHIGSFFRHVSSSLTHWDSNVSLFERNGVIDTIASHANHVATTLQGFYYLDFVFGVDSVENSHVFYFCGQHLWAYLLHFISRHAFVTGSSDPKIVGLNKAYRSIYLSMVWKATAVWYCYSFPALPWYMEAKLSIQHSGFLHEICQLHDKWKLHAQIS